jgi:hypothetical protein
MKEFGFLIYVMSVSNQLIACAGCLNTPLNWRRSIHHNDTLHNDTQDRELICDNQDRGFICDTQHKYKTCYAKCRYAKCHYDECRGASKLLG